MTGKTLIDCHVHLAALPDCDNGCYISPKMSQESVVSILAVEAPAVQKIININIMCYFNCLYGKHLF